MEPNGSSFVPKVHPLARDAEADDPYELVATRVSGDPDVMLECLLQEFAWLGWSADELWQLFHHPGYPLLMELREHFGDAELMARLRRLTERWGTLRFQEHIVEAEPEPELYEIQCPGAAVRPGCHVPEHN